MLLGGSVVFESHWDRFLDALLLGLGICYFSVSPRWIQGSRACWVLLNKGGNWVRRGFSLGTSNLARISSLRSKTKDRC